MSPLLRLSPVLLLMTLGVSLQAGEILILQPADSGQGSRSAREARALDDRAREQAGQVVPGAQYILVPEAGAPVPAPGSAERMRQDARSYVQPAAVGDSPPQLQAVPLSEAGRARLKASSYATDADRSKSRNCGAAANNVGTIGEGTGALKSEVAVEKGGSAVNPKCR